MTVGKHGKGYAVKHCRGKSKGKPIKGGKHATKKEAVAQHKAIQANKKGKGK